MKRAPENRRSKPAKLGRKSRKGARRGDTDQMYTDLFGNTRCRVNLHTHTTLSDGRKTPAEVAQLYHDAGYDALALTDHWTYGAAGEFDGMTILSGGEYNVKVCNTREGLFHIVGVGMTHDPEIPFQSTAQEIIHALRQAGGLVILAHPAWSLNTPAQILPLKYVDATEIYNTVSGVHMSRRPDSGLIVDMLGAQGRFYPLIADDDAHYYDNDCCRSWIMVEAADNSREALMHAIRVGKFYATQGPEVHLWREGNEMVVRCSPCAEIGFWSDWVFSHRVFTGDGLTEARYRIDPNEHYVRAEVTDREGRRAWTNCVVL